MRILTVVDYDEMWPTLFENERTLLQMTLGKVISRIHHIGSTSVPGLSAKPVIDILIEVANLEELDSLNQAMEGVGYTVRGENGILNRRYFTKGGNQRSHHIHAFKHALQTPCGFLQLSILNKRRGDKADNASFSMEALFHNPSGLAS